MLPQAFRIPHHRELLKHLPCCLQKHQRFNYLIAELFRKKFLHYRKFLPSGKSSSCTTCLFCVFLFLILKGVPSLSSRGDKVSTRTSDFPLLVKSRNNGDQFSQCCTIT